MIISNHFLNKWLQRMFFPKGGKGKTKLLTGNPNAACSSVRNDVEAMGTLVSWESLANYVRRSLGSEELSGSSGSAQHTVRS